MPRRLALPSSAFKDVQLLLQLDEEKLLILADLFGTSASITPHTTDFIREVTERLQLDTPTIESIVLVCQFLLTVVEEGNPPQDILNDVREFVAQHASIDQAGIVSALDGKRTLLESLLTPKPARSKALKVQYSWSPCCKDLPTSSEGSPRVTGEGQGEAVGLRSEVVTEASQSRNIAVAYEEVVLTEEDAEILRQMREAPTPTAGRPTRPPRRMQDG